MPPRHIHILFVHGVGTQTRLSSLLRPFQSLRTDPTSHELPARWENLIDADWELESFDDLPRSPCIILRQRANELNPDLPEKLILHEVNYSHLAGVIRENHPLDLPRLFVGLNLSVAIAKRGLDRFPPTSDIAGLTPDDNKAIAQRIQKLANVLVSVTVPVLGVVPLLAGSLGADVIVSTFKRFFEDIATFAMDPAGFALISKHLDQKTREIRTRPDFNAKDELIVAAHSLGSVVAHSYLVRNWEENSDGPPPMERLLTFGAPVSLLCWLWLFLDFFRMDINSDPAGRRVDEHVFAWEPIKLKKRVLRPIQWLNAVNFMDPIATSIPMEFTFIGATEQSRKAGLIGGEIDHRFIKPDSRLGPFPHTAYMVDRPASEKAPEIREMFVNILRDFAILRKPPSPPAPKIDAKTHWDSIQSKLLTYYFIAWAGGAVLMSWYLRGLCSPVKFISSSGWGPLIPFSLYFFPQFLVSILAFFQNLLWGGPTKRVTAQEFGTLSWASPFTIHLWLSPFVSPILHLLDRVLRIVGISIRFILSLAPFLFACLLPWWLLKAGRFPGVPSMYEAAIRLGVMTAALMLFIAAEFLRHWRAVLKVVFSARLKNESTPTSQPPLAA